MHITSVGHRPPGGEVPRDLVENSHVFVRSKVAFSSPPVGSTELQGMDVEFGTELGEVFLNQNLAEKTKMRPRSTDPWVTPWKM